MCCGAGRRFSVLATERGFHGKDSMLVRALWESECLCCSEDCMSRPLWSRVGLQCIRHPLKWFFGTRSCADVFQTLSWRSRCLQNMESYDTGLSSLLHDLHRCSATRLLEAAPPCAVWCRAFRYHCMFFVCPSIALKHRVCSAKRSATIMRCCSTSCIPASGIQPFIDYRPDSQSCRTANASMSCALSTNHFPNAENET
jgi:hypothetical protein